MTSKELMKTGGMPSYLKGATFDRRDTNMSASDIQMPNIKIAQDFIEGVQKPGEYVDSVTFESFGREIKIIILKQDKEWTKFSGSFELEARSSDGIVWDDELGTPLTDEEKWKNLQYKFTVLLEGKHSCIPYVMRLTGTSGKAGKKLLNYIFRFSEEDNLPIYARTYSIKSIEGKYEGSKLYYFSEASPGGFVSEVDYKRASKVYSQLKQGEFAESSTGSSPAENIDV